MRTKMLSVKKLISLMLCVVMCISLIPAQNYIDSVVAADEGTDTIDWTHPSILYVGDMKIATEGYWLNDGNGSLTTEGADETNYNVYYDGTGTLYLKGLNVTTTYSKTGIYVYSSSNFQINVTGENTVDISSLSDTYKYGLYSPKGDLYITGTGSLTCIASDDELVSTSLHRGVHANNLHIEGAKLKGSVGATSGSQDGYGVYVTSLTMQDGNLEGICSTTYDGYGIYVSGGTSCENSVITGTSGGRMYSYGVYTNGAMNCNNSTIYATTEKTSKQNRAINFAASSTVDLLIQNSEVYASSGQVPASSGSTIGIMVPSNCVLQVEKSQINATASSYYTTSSSITSTSTGISGSIELISGTITAKGMKKSFGTTPTLPTTDYWWRESNTGSYLKNNFETPVSTYCEITTETQEQVADAYIIFDANSGSYVDGSTQKRVMVKNGQIEPWEEPERTDYYFRGWYDAASSGTEVDFTDVEALKGTTVYAKWEATYRPTTFYIGSTQIMSAGYWKNNGAGALTTEGASETDYNVYYDGVNGLVFKDLNITTCYTNATTHYGIYAAIGNTGGNLDIEIIGENIIDVSSSSFSSLTYSRGIYARQLNLFGGGKLTVKSGRANSYSYAIQCRSGAFSANDVELYCVAGNGTSYSYGINAKAISVIDSIVNVKTTGATNRYGIYGYPITFENSEINCDSCGTYGIYAVADDVIIKNSTVSSVSNVTAVNGANLSVTSSDVTLQGTTKSMNLTGQLNYASGHLIASGSRTATVNITAQEYWWRVVKDDLFAKNNHPSFSTTYLELTTTKPGSVAKAAIIFDAGERTFTDDTSVKMIILEDGYITESQIPTMDIYAGYFFNYWQTEDGAEVDFTKQFSGTITLTPKYTQPSVLLANTDISEGGYWVNDGEGGITKDGASENNYNLYYNGSGTMKIKDLNIAQATLYRVSEYVSNYYGLYSKTSLSINAYGENKIDISAETSGVDRYGIYATGITLSGNGNIYIDSGESTASSSYGIYSSGAMNVSDVKLEAMGQISHSSVSYLGYGIYTTSTLTIASANIEATGSYGIYAKNGTTINGNAKIRATSEGSRSYESIYGSIVINEGTIIAERSSTGKCFSSTPTFSKDYWWRNKNEGGYLLNTYVNENSHYEELTTNEPEQIALTYVTLNGNGGTIDDVTTKTIFTDEDGNITKEIFDTAPGYTNYYFDGWFTETEYTNEVELYNTTFSEPTTLYAKWNAIEVTIGDINVTEGGYWINDGNESLTQKGASELNYNVYYDGESNLVLRNLNIMGLYDAVSYPAPLHFRVPITVTLIGDNIINSPTGAGSYALGDTTFEGAGSLKCVAPESSRIYTQTCFDIGGKLTIDQAKVCLDATLSPYGVSANSLSVINGGVLEAESGYASSSTSYTSYGIYVKNKLELVDGIIKGVGGEASSLWSNTYSYGIYANEIVISGGKLEGIAGEVYRTAGADYSPSYCSIGIRGATSIDISGGEIIGVGNDVDSINTYAYTFGISVSSGGTVNITGGKVTGQCGSVPTKITSTSQYGLSLNTGTFSMTDGELILEKGMSKAPSTLPEEYRWRTTETGEFTCSTDTAYKYSANNYLQIISENLVSEKTVTLYSITTDGMLSVSEVSGAGIYNVGNTVRIQADGLEEYIFTGWYVAEVDENNECIGYDADAKISSDIAYSFEITENVRYVAVYEKITSKVTGYTLSLNGDIAVNIHMTLAKEVLDNDTAYIKVTFADGESLEKQISELDTRVINGTVNYIFVCNVQAPEMNDEFVIELITESGNSELDTYSVKAYGDYLLNHTEGNEEYTEAAPVVRAMLNYGGYSQKQFGHNTGSLANAGLYTESEDPVLVGIVPTLETYAFTAPTKNIGVKYYGTSLLLNSETTIRHYFTFTEGEDIDEIRDKYEFKLSDGTILTPIMRGGMIYIDIKDINAADLDVKYAVTVTNIESSETFTFSYSALSYAKYVLDYALAGTNLVNVVRAMYFYNDAANAYFG